jgi:hypothetical protein
MTTHTVTGTYVDGKGTPLAGRVVFAPCVRGTDDTRVISAAPAVSVDLDAQGRFAVDLVASTPDTWWRLREPDGTTLWFVLDADLDVRTLTAATPPHVQVVGPTGATGAKGDTGATGPQGPKGDLGGTYALASTAPAAIASASSVGVATTAARADHVHKLPTASDVGAAAAVHTHTTANVTGLDAALAGKVAKSGDTMSGKLSVNASLRVAPGNATQGMAFVASAHIHNTDVVPNTPWTGPLVLEIPSNLDVSNGMLNVEVRGFGFAGSTVVGAWTMTIGGYAYAGSAGDPVTPRWYHTSAAMESPDAYGDIPVRLIATGHYTTSNVRHAIVLGDDTTKWALSTIWVLVGLGYAASARNSDPWTITKVATVPNTTDWPQQALVTVERSASRAWTSTELAKKANTSHSHAQTDVDGLTQALLGGNLLTADQAVVKVTQADGGMHWTGPAGGGSSTATADGVTLVSGASGAWSLYARPGKGITVTPGKTYTLRAKYVVNAGTNRTYYVRAQLFDAAGAVVLDARPAVLQISKSGISEVTFVAPATAAKADVYAAFTDAAGAAGDSITISEFGFWEGAGGDWAPPGTPITNQGIRTTHPNTDDVLCEQWDASKGRWQTTHYDSGIRRVVQTDTAGVVTVGSLPAGWVARPGIAGDLTVRRVNQRVRVEIRHLQSANAANHNDRMWTATAGFTNASTEGSLVMMNNGAKTIVISGLLDRGGGMTLAIGDFIYGGVVEYWTNDGIPTTLPGVSQTAAPSGVST